MRPLGRLENAYNISVTRRVNALWTASFTLPADDEKNALCSHMNYVEIVSPSGRYLGLYRIMPTETRKSIEADRITYRLEHVLSTLLDDVIDGLLPALINRTTRDNLERLLSFQETKNWRLGRVDFERYFEYSFENENGLLAPVLSIPQPFDEPYEFTYDTQSYPWTLNLVRPSDATRAEIRWGKDMISFDEVSDPTEIVNYIIPKGYGEGVNQLNISDVNGGRNYLQDEDSIEDWGKRPYIWIDRRFKHEEALKESAQSLLDEWKHPKISFEVDSVDLSVLPEYSHEPKHLNGVVRIVVPESVNEEPTIHYGRILEEQIPDLSKEFEVSYVIANRINDIATIQADLERKQQVNEAYSQGATNILTFQYQDNADEDIPARIQFFVDDDVVHINSAELTYDTERFRAYSRATAGGGAMVDTTESGGGSTRTTTSGGGTSRSTSSGGGSTQTSSSGGGTSTSTQTSGQSTQTSAAGGDHTHVMFSVVGYTGVANTDQNAVAGVSNSAGSNLLLPGANAGGSYRTQGSSGSHSHSVMTPAHTHDFTVPNHTHSVNIPNHSHEFTVPSHSHDVEIPNHTHTIRLPDHTHDVVHEIIELNRRPSSVEIRVDGNVVPVTSTRGSRVDIAEYLDRDSNGKIRRGRHVIEILPDDLGRIEAFLVMRVFIQSTLGSQL